MEKEEAITEPAISLVNVSKTFAGVRVLHEVSFDVLPGEIHGLVGQNGSGKSTLIKILSGFHEPDRGSELLVRGKPVPLPMTPGLTHRYGFAFVHQDLGLVPGLTVLENLRVGRYEPATGWRIRWGGEREEARVALGRIGIEIPQDARVGELQPVQRAIVAVARAMHDIAEHEYGLLVLDEPTAYLPRDAVQVLFDTIRRVAEAGVSVLFVSHRLDEVRSLTDRVTVIRDGRVAATVRTADTDEDQLISLMLGRALGNVYPEEHSQPADVGFGVLGLTGSLAQDIGFEVRRGEVLGLTGLIGMGQEEVPYLLMGASRASAGAIRIGGQALSATEITPAAAKRHGMALLPADRQGASGVGAFTVKENVSLPVLREFSPGGRIRHRRERSAVDGLLQEYQVRPPERERRLATLSGGNQQKALLAKWLQRRPEVLLLHEPTQGVDIGARAEIFDHIRRVSESGSCIVIVSNEYEDLAHICHRVLIFRDGRVVNTLTGEALSKDAIVAHSYRS